MEQINHCEVCINTFIGYSVYLHKEKHDLPKEFKREY